MTCGRCKKKYLKGKPGYFNSNPKCAFNVKGKYSTDNWQCATVNALRFLCELPACMQTRWYDDSIGVIPIGAEAAGFIVITWYKNRGTTGKATVQLDTTSRPMTLQDAEAALNFHKKDIHGRL